MARLSIIGRRAFYQLLRAIYPSEADSTAVGMVC